MKTMPPVYRSDIKPLEFTLAVFVGGIGSMLLSWLRVHALVSVCFALIVMIVLAILRWRIASEHKDYQSLEAFAEDIYLLGYLLTLAALLGLAPRLMSDETNLFHIAGLKLVTTVFGLALMMVFRQTARRWAEEREGEGTQKFIEQQRLFSGAVARLNEGADQLTAKLDEVVHRFDPALLVPLAEWSNRAAGAFSKTVNTLEAVPASIENGLQGLKALNEELAQVKAAAAQLSGVLTAGTAQAANVLAAELGEASRAASGMSASLAGIEPASKSAGGAIEKLGGQAILGATQLSEVNGSFQRTALEVGKVERAVKKMAEVWTTDLNAPINRLAQALEVSSANTTAFTEHINGLKSELEGAVAVGQELAKRMNLELAACRT